MESYNLRNGRRELQTERNTFQLLQIYFQKLQAKWVSPFSLFLNPYNPSYRFATARTLNNLFCSFQILSGGLLNYNE